MSIRLIILSVLVSISGLATATSAFGEEPPDGVQVFEAPPAPAPGTRFTYSYSDGRRSTVKVSRDTSPFKGQAVYRMINRSSRNNRETVWDAETHNLVAVFNSSGTLLRYYSPHESEFHWPLWVGKSTRSIFKQVVKRSTGGRRTGVFRKSGRTKVEAMETITTPLGMFETMRVKVSVSGWSPVTFWWARDIPVPIKYRSNRVRTLVEIRKPKN